MRVTFKDLWRPTGKIDRGTYALIGVIGFAVKNNLDRGVAAFAFRRPWSLLSYWMPARDVARITQLSRSEAVFLGTMVALAVPFVWVGVTQTVRRLRSAGLPLGLVVLFFVPFLNLLFFLSLCLIPERDSEPIERVLPTEPFLSRIIPESAVGSAAASLLLTVPAGIGMVMLGANVLGHYGWGVFVALPFTVGFASAVIYGIREPRSAKGCVGVGCFAALLWGFALLAIAFEGLVCLIMVVPIALPIAALGGACGYMVQRRRWIQSGSPAFLSVLLIFVPGVQWTEHVIGPVPETFSVRSTIEVHAPPEKVWKQVVAFTEIPPPTEWMFRAGIAYPIRAEMVGRGPGAERHCVFSTGAFVEPIQVWDEPHRLKFSVTSNPPPMEEWTPYPHIDPPHLHGFMVSNGGQFLLTPLPDGGTRLEGTTWYRHGLWPATYWRVWSDLVIHRIHMRVLTHIREEAEKGSFN